MSPLEASLTSKDSFLGCVTLQEGLTRTSVPACRVLHRRAWRNCTASLNGNQAAWKEYWNKSGMKLSDEFLERIWYRNLYFLNCATKDGATTPGLFANWSYNDIGTAWHGDYHMNYNTQQPFWATFSSNHLEKNLPVRQPDRVPDGA